MLTSGAALEAVLGAMPTLDSETIGAGAAIGRILRQAVVAERDQPPFDRVMMDGIAFAFADFADGIRRFPVQATQAAGDARLVLEPGTAIEIMTGAALPAGADCIVPVERTSVSGHTAVIEDGYEPKQSQFIHAQGSDHAAGTELLSPGRRIAATDIAIVASCGLTEVAVSRTPRVCVISTGNELVPAGKAIEPHQVRLSNGPAVIAMLAEHGFNDSWHDHIVDERAQLEARIGEHLASADALVLSGGVSMGKADYVPQVLADLGVELVFHKISQRPGKPMWFGIGPEGQPVFALPGNPVSTLVCCRQYVIPALHQACGRLPEAPDFASLTQDVTFEPALTCFLPVRLLSNVTGGILAMPVHTNTSGDFASLSGTDGYVELPLEQNQFPAGSALRLHRWLSAN
jgi:molybdopterin molybdotransferase